MELRCLFWGKQTKNWITQCLLPLLIGSTTHAGQLHSPVVKLQWKTVQIFRRGSAKFCVRKYRHSKLMSNLRWFYHLGEFKSGTSLHQETGTETVFSLKIEKVVLRYIPIYQYIYNFLVKNPEQGMQTFPDHLRSKISITICHNAFTDIYIMNVFQHPRKHISHPFCFLFLPNQA